MYKIKIALVGILLIHMNYGLSQSKLILFDSIVGINHEPRGITVYPIDFQKIKVSEELLLDLNTAHYHAVEQSGAVKSKFELSKKYVKKNEYDVSLAGIIGHSPKNLISTLKVRALEQTGDSDSEYSPLKSIELLAEHAIYDITTGKQLCMKVLDIEPNITNIKNRSEQYKELSKVVKEQITASMKERFPVYAYLTSISKVEKEKAISVDIDNNFSTQTQKQDLYVNIIKNTYYLDNLTYYHFETIGRVDFDKKIDEKKSSYKVTKGKEEINSYSINNKAMILSIKPLE